MRTPKIDSIFYEGTQYFYEERLAKNGEKCLATKDPKKYCNGFYSYSDKDEGDGVEFVLLNQSHKDKEDQGDKKDPK